MENVENLLREKPIILPRYLFNYYIRLGITSEELIILIFIIDRGDKAEYNPEAIASALCLDKFKVMELIDSLNNKKIISLEVEKNKDGKREEYISLDLMYKKIMNIILDKEETKTFDNGDIFSVFESEFGRTISSMECQIIKGWIDDKFSGELIMEALKEAIYNGVSSLKYIETILYNWRKKGYKTKAEVRDAKNKYYETKKEQKEEKEIFYYDWLNDD